MSLDSASSGHVGGTVTLCLQNHAVPDVIATPVHDDVRKLRLWPRLPGNPLVLVVYGQGHLKGVRPTKPLKPQ
jgi:hypothetical protein